MTNWNERYLKGDTPWEKGEAAPPLIELLETRGSEVFGTGTVLVPGCGSGHDVRALAGSGLDVLGVDIAGEALMRAAGYEKSGNEHYEKADFLSPQWRSGKTFSAIWEHTCFCAIDPSRRPDYAQSCADLIESGGHLVGAFFLTPNEPGEEHQGPPFNSTIAELDKIFSPWFDRTDAWVPGRAYPGREGQEWLAIYRRK